MRLINSRWILIGLLVTLIFSILIGCASPALGGGAANQGDPVETEASVKHTQYLILGAFIIVLVILGAVWFRQPKS